MLRSKQYIHGRRGAAKGSRHREDSARDDPCRRPPPPPPHPSTGRQLGNLRGDSITYGWLKPDFVKRFWSDQ